MKPTHSRTAAARQGIFWLWLACVLGVCWALAIAVAHSPPQLKRLFLMPAGYGLACSLIAGLLWQNLVPAKSPTSPKLANWLIALLAIAGLAYSGLASYQMFASECRRASQDPNNLMGIQFLQLDSAMQHSERLAELKALKNPTFDMYLRHRTRQLGKWGSSAALALWLAELLLAGAVARSVFPLAAGDNPTNVIGDDRSP